MTVDTTIHDLSVFTIDAPYVEESELHNLISKLKPLNRAMVTDGMLLKRMMSAFNDHVDTTSQEGFLLRTQLAKMNLSDKETGIVKEVLNYVANPTVNGIEVYEKSDQGWTVGFMRFYVNDSRMYRLFDGLSDGSKNQTILKILFS